MNEYHLTQLPMVVDSKYLALVEEDDIMDFEDLEPRSKVKKPKQLDDMSVGDLKEYVAALQAEIVRVEAAIKAKQAHLEAMNALFKSPE